MGWLVFIFSCGKPKIKLPAYFFVTGPGPGTSSATAIFFGPIHATTPIKTRNYFYRDNSKEKWEKIKYLHFGTIEKAANKYSQLRANSQKNTSFELLKYLKNNIFPDLPFPEYIELKVSDRNRFSNTGYWIFFCNPKFWQIDEFLEIDEINSTWKISHWQSEHFQKGQFAVIRVGNDSRTKAELAGKERLKAGIYGIVEIVSQAKPIPDSARQFWLDLEKYGDQYLRVKIRFIKKLLENPILISDLKNLTDFQNEKSLLNGRQYSSWSLEKDTFDKILELAERNIEIVREAKTAEPNNYSDLQKLEAKYSNATPRVKEIVSQRIERGYISKVYFTTLGFVQKSESWEL